MSVKELDSIITLLAEKKKNMEQQESETNMQILLVFLHCLRKQKMDELNEVSTFFSWWLLSGLHLLTGSNDFKLPGYLNLIKTVLGSITNGSWFILLVEITRYDSSEF
jgi:hypothetical protein